MTVSTAVWTYTAGQVPYAVTAYERATKGNVVYLRWRATTKKGRNWVHKSLKTALRDAAGRIDKAKERLVVEETNRQLARLLGELPKAEVATRLTLNDGWVRISDRKVGKYPTNTPHRREVERALRYTMAVWGADRPWDSIKKADLRSLWRRRIEELTGEGDRGLRGAEVTIARLLGVAGWLRDEELVPATACVPSRHWKRELADDWRTITESRGDYEPARPRHTLDEMQAILRVAPQVDPRFGLILALGAELRPGQVLRAMRSDLDLEKGTFTVRAKGRKRGVVEYLTKGQLAAVREAFTNGYLRLIAYSAGPAIDFPLFPATQLIGGRSGDPRAEMRHLSAKPVNRRTLQAWFKEAETLAKITHQPGRSTYGLRRAAVDAAKDLGISREGLKEHGGWTDSQMPDQVYADQESEKAREEARDVRAKIRGEE
jgi:integrase